MKPGPLFLLAACLVAGCSSGGDRPNVLLITVDTLRADALGVYGNDRAATPRMDRLAAEGVLFRRAKSACPITLPSHLTMLTGLYPAEHGFRDNDPPRALPGKDLRDFDLLAERFSAAGYATAAFVSASVLSMRTGIGQGFDVYDGPAESTPGRLVFAERTGRKTAEKVVSWLNGAKRPFFLWVHFFDPHDPYLPPVAFRSGAAPHTPAAYADEVTYADHCVGLVLDGLSKAGFAGRTLVALTADHGEGLGQHGESTHGFLLYETTLSVPLLFRWPGHLEAGSTRTDLVSLVDLAPTLLSAARLGVGERSFLDKPLARRPVAETLYGYRHMGWAQLLCAWEGPRKLVQGVRYRTFDLDTDPGETTPEEGSDERLEDVLDGYRTLRSRVGNAKGEALEPLAGHAYLSGLGRGRLALIPEEENARLREPDGRRVDRIGRAIARVGRDDPDAVRVELKALIASDPSNPTLYFWLGRNEAAAGRHPEAALAFLKTFEKGHREAKVLSLWLKSLILAGRVEEARSIAKENLPRIVPDAGVWVVTGELWRLSGDPEEAAKCADRAARLARTERDRELVSRFRHNLKQSKEQ